MWMTQDFAGASIVVADDDPTNLQVLDSMLGELGCEVRLTRSGEMLLQSVALKLPDLILLDVHMPGLDGYQTCAQLKANQESKDIPVIFVSALNEEFSKVKGFKSGAVDYITKPFQLEELKAHIGVHLRLARQARELRNLQAAVEQSRTSILITDLEGNIEYANQSTAEISGYEMSEIIGSNPRIFKSNVHPVSLYKELWNTISQGNVWHGELCNRKSDGSLYWELVVISPVRVIGGSFTRYVAVKEDITQQRELREQLIRAKELAESANQAKSAFLAMMSHEIRTPMNGVIGMIDLLNQTKLDAEQQRLARIAKVSSVSLLNIINDILDFSKIEAGRMKLESIPVAWRNLIDNVAEMVSNSLLDKNLLLYCLVDPDIPVRVYGDQARLRQILLNLLSNAIKFTHSDTHKRGEIFVRLYKPHPTSDNLILEVQDNGIGISKSKLDNLFKPFVQADNSTHRRYGGTGLGLTICNRLVHLMNGEISCVSEEGTGSTFTVHLPGIDANHTQNASPPFEDCRIYLVSNQDFIKQYLTKDLAALGAEVVIADQQTPRDDHNQQQEIILFAGNWAQEQEWPLIQSYLNRCPDIPCVVLISAHEHPPFSRCIQVDSNPFRPEAIHKALNIAIGRETSESEQFDASIGKAPPAPTPEQAEAEGRLILVAEDNVVNQEVIQLQLKLLGYTAEVVDNGKQALEHMRHHSYGLLLTDCHMPEMDGFELTAAVRDLESQGKARIPIVAITANVMQGEAQRCLMAGMDGYLAKPVELFKLKDVLQQWIPMSDSSISDKSINSDIKTEPSIEMAPRPLLNVRNKHNQDSIQIGSLNKGPETVINPQLLHQYLGDDPDIHREYLRKFVHDTQAAFSSVDDLVKQQYWSEIATLMHKLKSSSKAIGASVLSESCIRLERAAKAEDGQQVQSFAMQVNREVKRVCEYVAQLPD